jgi:hypothetical protein
LRHPDVATFASTDAGGVSSSRPADEQQQQQQHQARHAGQAGGSLAYIYPWT